MKRRPFVGHWYQTWRVLCIVLQHLPPAKVLYGKKHSFNIIMCLLLTAIVPVFLRPVVRGARDAAFRNNGGGIAGGAMTDIRRACRVPSTCLGLFAGLDGFREK